MNVLMLRNSPATPGFKKGDFCLRITRSMGQRLKVTCLIIGLRLLF